ncbi:MAG: nitroreductase family protein [Candidatus Krumholzibacteriia bacterium]
MVRPAFLDFVTGLVRIIAARPRVARPLAGNPVLAAVLGRRSVRAFRSRELQPDVWEAILEAGRLAPSTVNLQTWSFVEFTADTWRTTFGRPLPFGAARAVMVLADVHRARRAVEGFPYSPLCEYTVGVMNASLAAMAMTIAGEGLGVASVMLSETGRTGFYDAGDLAGRLELPPGVVPIMSIAFGYPRHAPPPMPPRLPRTAVAFPPPYRETEQDVLDAWMQQMQAGYSASNPGRRFRSQILHYNRRIGQAERDLRRLVFYAGEPHDEREES